MKRLNLPISIRIARWIRKGSRITLWLSTGCLLIDLMSPLGGPTAALWVAIVLAILIDLSALKIGQRLASREFAALIAANPVTNHRIILYLRSFNMARRSLGAMFMLQVLHIVHLVTLLEGGHGEPDVHRPYGIEERLDEAIGLNAMFVAIGDQLLSYGAAKIPVKDEDWQNIFYRLANASQLIFMLPGRSPGALWELGQILRSRRLLEKTVFIMPAAFSSEWEHVSVEAAEIGVRLPRYFRNGCYFRLREDGQPTEIVALEPFTRALSKFVASPAYTGVIDFADVLKLV